MSSRLSICLLCAAALVSTAAWPQSSPSPRSPSSPREGLLVLVDHAATSAEAADACDKQAPGSGAAIRDAHARWQTEHGAAQSQLLELMLKQMQAAAAARGDPAQDAAAVLALFRTASLDKLRSSMHAMDAPRLAQFCAGYPSEFDKPAMDFTALWLRTRSRQ